MSNSTAFTTVDSLTAYAASACDAKQDHERQVADIVAREWTRRTAREARRKAKIVGHRRDSLSAAVTRRAKQQAATLGIASLFIGELLGWLIGKLLSALWDWWTREPDAVTLVCGMA